MTDGGWTASPQRAPGTLGALLPALDVLGSLLRRHPHLQVSQTLISDHDDYHDDRHPDLRLLLRLPTPAVLQAWVAAQHGALVTRSESDGDIVATWSLVGADVTARASLDTPAEPTIDALPVTDAAVHLARSHPHLPLSWLTLTRTGGGGVPAAAAATERKADALTWLSVLPTWWASLDDDGEELRYCASGTIKGVPVCAWGLESLTTSALPGAVTG